MKIIFFTLKGFFLKNKIKKAFNEVLKNLKIDGKNLKVNVGFVSESAIQKLNQEHRNIDKITDVLSFPLLELEVGTFITQELYNKEKHPKTGILELGDIIICENVAKMQAQKYQHSYLREIVFLSVHGFLHILGFDHQSQQEEEQMNSLCESILTKIGVKR